MDHFASRRRRQEPLRRPQAGFRGRFPAPSRPLREARRGSVSPRGLQPIPLEFVLDRGRARRLREAREFQRAACFRELAALPEIATPAVATSLGSPGRPGLREAAAGPVEAVAWRFPGRPCERRSGQCFCAKFQAARIARKARWLPEAPRSLAASCCHWPPAARNYSTVARGPWSAAVLAGLSVWPGTPALPDSAIALKCGPGWPARKDFQDRLSWPLSTARWLPVSCRLAEDFAPDTRAPRRYRVAGSPLCEKA